MKWTIKCHLQFYFYSFFKSAKIVGPPVCVHTVQVIRLWCFSCRFFLFKLYKYFEHFVNKVLYFSIGFLNFDYQVSETALLVSTIYFKIYCINRPVLIVLESSNLRHMHIYLFLRPKCSSHGWISKTYSSVLTAYASNTFVDRRCYLAGLWWH